MSKGKHSSYIHNSSKNNIKSEKKRNTHKKSKHLKIKWLILILLLVIVILLGVFFTFHDNIHKYFFKTDEFNETNSISTEDENVKKIANYETLEAFDFKIENKETQSNVYITLHNTSSETCPNLNLSISLVNAQNESILSFDAYTNEILPDDTQIIKMHTKQDISQVTDFTISKKD